MTNWKPIWRAFKSGILYIHPLLFLFVSVFVVGILIFIEWFFRSGYYTVIPEKYYLALQHDERAHITYSVAKFARVPPPLNSVFFFGGSSMVEAINEKSPKFQKVKQNTGQDVTVHNLGGVCQTFGETIVLLENLPNKSMVVIGMNVVRFSYDPTDFLNQFKGHYYNLKSSAFKAFMINNGLSSWKSHLYSPWFYLRLPAYLGNKLDRIVKQSHRPLFVEYYPYRYRHINIETMSDEMYNNMIEKNINMAKKQVLPRFKTNINFNLSALIQLVKTGKEKGHRMIFMDLPHNPKAMALYKDDVNQYHLLVDEIADEYKIPYWKFAWNMESYKNYFVDFFHVTEAGAQIFQDSISTNLSRYLLNQK